MTKKYFISYRIFNRNLIPQYTRVINRVIETHPLKWIEKTPSFEILFYKELSDTEIKELNEVKIQN